MRIYQFIALEKWQLHEYWTRKGEDMTICQAFELHD